MTSARTALFLALLVSLALLTVATFEVLERVQAEPSDESVVAQQEGVRVVAEIRGSPNLGDSDGDGFSASVEAYVGTDPSIRCGEGVEAGPSTAWPADFISGGILDSTDKVNVIDLVTFLAPIRRLGTNPGDADFDQRWDLKPGPTFPFPDSINTGDLVALIASAENGTAFPPMFGGTTRALNGPVCTDL